MPIWPAVGKPNLAHLAVLVQIVSCLFTFRSSQNEKKVIPDDVYTVGSNNVHHYHADVETISQLNEMSFSVREGHPQLEQDQEDQSPENNGAPTPEINGTHSIHEFSLILPNYQNYKQLSNYKQLNSQEKNMLICI